jgi:hypothetical protein
LRSVEGRPVPAGVVAKFTDGYAAAPVSDFTATINWGDGPSSSPGAVSAAPGGGFQVTGGPHTYRNQGQFSTVVTVNDKGGSSATIRGAANIRDAPIVAKGVRIQAHIGKPFRGPVATFADANARAPRATTRSGSTGETVAVRDVHGKRPDRHRHPHVGGPG